MDPIIARTYAVLSTTAPRLAQLAASMPADLFSRSPAPGAWSALECLQHLVDTEQIFPLRVTALRQSEDIPAFNPDQEGTQTDPAATPIDLAAAFARLRTENLALLRGVRAAELDHGGVHSELGPVTLGQLLHEWPAHDLNHLIQIERALMQPFIAGSGAWQFYFAEHQANAGEEEHHGV